jgi:hypothetical protein
MDRFVRPLGPVLAGLLCCALVAIPLHAAETDKSESAKRSQKATRESALVKASREIQNKKTGTAKTYSNEDLKEEQPTTQVFTNEDLTRMFGPAEESEPEPSGSGAQATADTPENAPDPLALMEQEQKDQASREQTIAEAEAKLAAAQEKLKNLEVQLLATRNPFSARPELSEEEQEQRATSGETAAERNARTQKLVEEAKAEVAEAEVELRRARGQ